MPRNSSGTYTLPSGINPVVAGTTVAASWANTTLSDVGSEVTNSLDRQGRGSMLAPLKLFDGLVASPGLTFSGESTTGFYRPSAGNLGVSVGGANVGTWKAAGLSLPLGSVGAPSLSFFNDANAGMWSPAADVIAWRTAGAHSRCSLR